MRIVALSLILFCFNGCTMKKPEAVPVLLPIAGIKARLLDVPEFSLSRSALIEIPLDQLKVFARLVVPTAPCLQQIDPKLSYHVADVIIEHNDGTFSTLMVRWTGHNPAAISLDGSKYYYGELDEFPDGATRIMRLLGEYEFNSRKSIKNQGIEKGESKFDPETAGKQPSQK